MVEYSPAPKDLSRLNPIQRYMQKGSLDWSDWMRLGAIVLAYWLLRPYCQKLAKRWSDESVRQGEEETEAYKQRRAAAVGANDIRSAQKPADGKTLGQLLDQGSDAFIKTADTNTTAVSTSKQDTTDVKKRKKKSKGVSFAPEKSEVDKTLDWEDESEFDPKRKPVVGEGEEQGEVEQWLNRWS